MNHATVVAVGITKFAQSEALKQALAAATSVEEINVISWRPQNTTDMLPHKTNNKLVS